MPLTGEYAPSTVDWVREHVERYESSGGTDGATFQGFPIVLLTSVGAKSGKLRKNPLIRVKHDGEYLAVASNGGEPRHPVWYYNLVENPRVDLRDGTVTGAYTAREVTGDEEAIWWARALAVQPEYAVYQERTDREIPLFVLTPVSDAPESDRRPFDPRARQPTERRDAPVTPSLA